MCYAICSNLIDDASTNALVVLQLGCGDEGAWDQITSMKEVPLLTQDSCCHRVCPCVAGIPTEKQSVVVTELASSRVMQLQLHHLCPSQTTLLADKRKADEATCGGPARVYEYSAIGALDTKSSGLDKEKMNMVRAPPPTRRTTHGRPASRSERARVRRPVARVA